MGRLNLTPRAGALAALVVIAVVLAGVLIARGAGGGESGPPSDGAARLVPSDALVYLHLSIDGDREETKRAQELAERFPSFATLRDTLLGRLSAPGCKITRADLKGKDAALALLPGAGKEAGSLVLVDTGVERKTTVPRRCGQLSTVFIGRYLAIGQAGALQVAAALKDGAQGSLAADPEYRKLSADLPDDRVADGWASRDGVRRLLAPQGGILGAAGVLLDQPALEGVTFALAAGERSAKLTVRSLLGKRSNVSPFRPFAPTLHEAVPKGALAYLGVRGLSTALSRLLTAAGSTAESLAPLVGRLDKQILDLFSGEVAIVLTPAVPAPVLTLIAPAKDEAAARRALGKLPTALKAVFRTTVADGRLIVSTSQAGVNAVKDGKDQLPDQDSWRSTVSGVPDLVTSLLFLDFNRLLRLGEQTGLNDSRAYLRVKDDLAKVRALGAHSSSDGSESTAEITLSIP